MNTSTDLKEQLSEWIIKKNYVSIENWTVHQLITQIRIRLDLIDHALRNSGYISNDIRWKQLNRDEIHLVEKIDSEPLSSKLCPVQCEHVELLSKDSLKALGELNLQHPEQNHKNYRYSSNKNERHNNSVNRNQYLVNTDHDASGIVLFIPLSEVDDSQCINDVEKVIKQVRETFKLPEPENNNNSPSIRTIKSLLNNHSIMYLDTCLFLIQNQSLTTMPNQNSLIATAISLHPMYHKQGGPEEIGSDTINQWNKDFYRPKLLNKQWITLLKLHTKSNKSLLNQLIKDINQ